MFYSTKIYSPVGNITLASDGECLNGLWIENQKYYGDTIPEKMITNDKLEVFKQTEEWLKRYFNGKKPTISELPLRPIGNDFRQKVWKLLCEIPYGQVTTYGKIAHEIARQRGLITMSAQAVGGAVGHNPISIIIPCHRVVGTNGSLTGYSGGIQTKVKLLVHEGVDMSHYYVPKRGTAI